jgi:hypothetical protein
MGRYIIMDVPMVNNITSSKLQYTKPRYNGARETEDDNIMSSVPTNSHDSPRAQVGTNMAQPYWICRMSGMPMIRTYRICDVYNSTNQREYNERAQIIVGDKFHDYTTMFMVNMDCQDTERSKTMILAYKNIHQIALL